MDFPDEYAAKIIQGDQGALEASALVLTTRNPGLCFFVAKEIVKRSVEFSASSNDFRRSYRAGNDAACQRLLQQNLAPLAAQKDLCSESYCISCRSIGMVGQPGFNVEDVLTPADADGLRIIGQMIIDKKKSLSGEEATKMDNAAMVLILLGAKAKLAGELLLELAEQKKYAASLLKSLDCLADDLK